MKSALKAARCHARRSICTCLLIGGGVHRGEAGYEDYEGKGPHACHGVVEAIRYMLSRFACYLELDHSRVVDHVCQNLRVRSQSLPRK